jgi:hypothetical protein
MDEGSVSLVEVEGIGEALFHDLAQGGDGEAPGPFGVGDWLTIDLDHLGPTVDDLHAVGGGRLIGDGIGTVMGDVEIEVAVAIGISEGEGRAGGLGEETGSAGGFAEAAGTVIEEKADTAIEGGNEQVGVAIAIEVGEGGAGGVLVGAGDTGGGGDVFESAVTEVSVEGVIGFEAAEIEIRQAIAIDISGGDAGAIEEVAIEDGAIGGDAIGEGDAEFGRCEALETSGAWGGVKGKGTETGMLLPGGGGELEVEVEGD